VLGEGSGGSRGVGDTRCLCGSQVVTLTLKACTLGRIQIPVRVRALGSKAAPLECVINAKCIGPQLDFGEEPEAR
jgi:hydrocephalus-inducing protein